MHKYGLYGLRLNSSWLIPSPELTVADSPDVELVEGPAPQCQDSSQTGSTCSGCSSWFQYTRDEDGYDFLRWNGLFSFSVSPNGRLISGHYVGNASLEAFQTYLLGQVLSFSLLKLGMEPLHSTAVVVQGDAVAFLGDSGYGKSSLAAAFLQQQYPLLTDDLMVLKDQAPCFRAYPGMPRIKLFPDVARRLLSAHADGVPMNNLTPKLIIPLNDPLICQDVVPLRAIYVLRSPCGNDGRNQIAIRPLSPRQAFLSLLQNTFNSIVVEPERLKRQFALALQIVSRVPIKSLSFTRDLSLLPSVREAILSDLRQLPVPTVESVDVREGSFQANVIR